MYNVIVIDPRPAQKDAMIALLQAHSPVIGIEFTLPALSQYLVGNIDDQHVTGASNNAACKVALGVALPPVNTTLAIVRPDVDALLAIVILNERITGNPISSEMYDRIFLIAKNDTFANGEWPGVRPLTLKEEETEFEGLGVIAMDFKRPIQERMVLIREWLLTGNCDGLDVARRQAVDMFNNSVESSKISFLNDDPDSGVALVESIHMKATSVGYHYAPVVVIRNPEFRFAGGEPHVKYTICAWKEQYVNWDALKKALNELESGWGGSASIIGSPQGVSSSLSMQQVAVLVGRHLV